MNRGSAAGRPMPDRTTARFNEAPIHESGKSSTVLPISNPIVASMRPRFMNRGSSQATGGSLAIVFSFNEAPIHESGK